MDVTGTDAKRSSPPTAKSNLVDRDGSEIELGYSCDGAKKKLPINGNELFARF